VTPLLIEKIFLCSCLGEKRGGERGPGFMGRLSGEDGYTNFFRDCQHDA
ncbi:hypothetical protein CRG98_049499, partial [Punica granatum]